MTTTHRRPMRGLTVRTERSAEPVSLDAWADAFVAALLPLATAPAQLSEAS